MKQSLHLTSVQPDTLINAQKTVLGEVKMVGGTQTVIVGNKMNNLVKMTIGKLKRLKSGKEKERKKINLIRKEKSLKIERKRRYYWKSRSEKTKLLVRNRISCWKMFWRKHNDNNMKAAIACSKLARANM